MKNVFTTGKLLTAVLGMTALFLLGSVGEDKSRPLPAEGTEEAAAVASEMDSAWSELAASDPCLVLEAVAISGK